MLKMKNVFQKGLNDAFSSCTVLVNPTRHPVRASRLIRMLHRMETPRVLVSESESDFTNSVRDFLDSDVEHLLIYGGDGTIQRSLNILVPALMKNDRARFKSIGFFRGGSGNGYHDSYRIPRTVKRQLETLAESVCSKCAVPVDIMKITQGSLTRYGQLFGMGFDAEVLKRRNARSVTFGIKKKPKPGLLNYVRSALATFFSLELDCTRVSDSIHADKYDEGSVRLEIRMEKTNPTETFHTRAPMIEIGKRPFYGNCFKVCPGARPDGGPMELVLFDFSRKPCIFFSLFPLWMGWHGWVNRTHGKQGTVPLKHFQAYSCTITSKDPFAFHVDGELISPKNAPKRDYTTTISILPGALSFLVPAKQFASTHSCS
jgi:diacylglycerol kinase family enzyme